MTTMRDIAKQAGVAVSTVSRALNNSGYVSEATRKRIEAVVQRTRYVPNAIAQDLSAGATHHIGVVVPHLNHPYFTQLVTGIIGAALDSAYQVTVLPSAYAHATETAYLERLRRHALDGLIFTSHQLPLTTIATYTSFGPIVVCEDPGQVPVSAVYADRMPSYLEAFSWLRQKGVRQIGFTFSRKEAVSATTQAILSAFRQQFGQEPKTQWCFDPVTTFEDGLAVGQRWLAMRHRPTCFFTNGDSVAAGIHLACARAKVTPPLLVGQEHQETGRLLNLPTIDHHFNRIGRQAFTLVTADPDSQTRLAIGSQFILPEQ